MGVKLGTALGLFFLTILAGVWLSNSGKPFNTLLFTAHKLLALGAVLLAAWVSVLWLKSGVPKPWMMFLLICIAVLAVALFATGVLLSQTKTVPAWVMPVHRVSTLLTLLASTAALWSLKK